MLVAAVVVRGAACLQVPVIHGFADSTARWTAVRTIRQRTTTTSTAGRSRSIHTSSTTAARCQSIHSQSSSSLSSSSEDDNTSVSPPLILPFQKEQQVRMMIPPVQPIRHAVAPMVAASDYAFRCLCRQHYNKNNHSNSHDQRPPLLTFTQMWHSKNLIQDTTFLNNHFDLYEYEDPTTTAARWLPHHDDDNNYQSATTGPVVVQLAGHCPETVLRAAQLVVERTQGRVAGIDLNLGCPQGIARKGRYGAFLHQLDPDTCHDILRTLRQNLPCRVAVSAKIRLPLEKQQLAERIERLCDTGVDFLTVHGRTLRENKSLNGPVHVSSLQQAVQVAAARGVPVIVNGGIETPADVDRLLQMTGAAAVMSSEALLERPNLFGLVGTDDDDDTKTPQQRFDEQMDLAHDYWHVWCRYAPPLPGTLGRGPAGSFSIARAHLLKILHRYFREQPDLRQRLTDIQDNQPLDQAAIVLQLLRERYDGIQDWDTRSSSQVPQATWYRRHWTANARATNTTRHIPVSAVSVEDRKREIRERIAHLQAARPTQQATATTTL